jgi:hypothetical protein
MTGKWDKLLQSLGGGLKGPTTLQNMVAAMTSQPPSQVGPFTKFVFPIIRRALPQLVAPNLVSVQPMTGPIGGIAFYGLEYGGYGNPAKVGDSVQSERKINKKIITGVIQEIVMGTRQGIKLNLAVVEDASTGKKHRILPTDLKKVTPLDVLATVQGKTIHAGTGSD